ncbi:MAG: hypothetical protein LBQ88_11680 [Treponema sp.]|jgi:hypothetical protein|nr:hypothetical protein [Treponema sp.]
MKLRITIDNTAPVTGARKLQVKETALEFCRDRRISPEMAVWAMKNAGYTEDEAAEWLGVSPLERSIECKKNSL